MVIPPTSVPFDATHAWSSGLSTRTAQHCTHSSWLPNSRLWLRRQWLSSPWRLEKSVLEQSRHASLAICGG